MEMNFPHHDLPRATLERADDFRALLAHAISRQGNSETARAMLRSVRDENDACEDQGGFLEQRIAYFGVNTALRQQRVSPRGAFYVVNSSKNDVESNCKQAVYQDASVKIKSDSILPKSSDYPSVHAGQEN
jgi:hypothetical protein